MERKQTSSRRLRLHRQTLRTLSGRALAGIAGGFDGSLVVIAVKYLGGEDDPQPKSNAWTGGTDVGAYCQD